MLGYFFVFLFIVTGILMYDMYSQSLKSKPQYMNSSLFTLNSKDFGKGLIVAVLTAVITVIYNTVQTGSLVFDWKSISVAALSAALAYITKNLFTNSQDQLLTKEPNAEEN